MKLKEIIRQKIIEKIRPYLDQVTMSRDDDLFEIVIQCGGVIYYHHFLLRTAQQHLDTLSEELSNLLEPVWQHQIGLEVVTISEEITIKYLKGLDILKVAAAKYKKGGVVGEILKKLQVETTDYWAQLLDKTTTDSQNKHHKHPNVASSQLTLSKKSSLKSAKTQDKSKKNVRFSDVIESAQIIEPQFKSSLQKEIVKIAAFLDDREGIRPEPTSFRARSNAFSFKRFFETNQSADETNLPLPIKSINSEQEKCNDEEGQEIFTVTP